MSTFLAELLGTMILIIFGCGVVGGVLLQHSKAQNSGWIVITIAWGLAVTMGVYAVGKVSGAHLNPAVTIGLAAVGEFPWENVGSYILAQLIGGFLGATLVWLHYLPHWDKTTDEGTKLAVFATAPAIRANWSNLFSETIGTFLLLLGLSFIGANQFAEGLNPLVVGTLILAIGLSLGGTTGYAINPVRDFAPRLAHFLLPISGKGNSDWSYAFIPIVGPILGGVLGTSVYQWLFQQKTSLWLWITLAGFLVVAILAVNENLRKSSS
ncbi:MAG: aquaporin family protein [Saprospiraceae bacterium]|nr:aquaporin family protein [Saprospiraceae bacterium]